MTGTVPRARRRANPLPPEPVVPPAPSEPGATAAGARPGSAPAPGAPAPGAPPPAERLASLLAEARGDTTGPGLAPSPPNRSPGVAPAHRRQVAARTRVPASLLLIALAALAWLSWTVLGPGRDGEAAPETAGRPVLAEAELDGDPGRVTGQDGGSDTGHGAGHGAGTATGPATGPQGAAAAQPPAAASTLHVHVTGEVARPGVVSLEAGARVVDAVEAAGGLTDAAVTESVNLAAPVTDGQQVLVPDGETAPVPGPAAAGPGTGAPGAAAAPGAAVPPGPGAPDGAAPGGTLNLNTATAAELEALPRVGPVLAGRIVEFREQHGGFAAVADLDAVPGIGPALMESLGPLVSV